MQVSANDILTNNHFILRLDTHAFPIFLCNLRRMMAKKK